MEPEIDRLLTLREVADQVGGNLGDVRRLVHSGDLVAEPYVTGDGRQLIGVRQWRVAAYLLDHPNGT